MYYIFPLGAWLCQRIFVSLQRITIDINMEETKLISIRVNARIIKALDQACVHNHYRNRSYHLNKMIELGMALWESNQRKIIENFCYSRGDKVQIHDYDIEKGDWSNLKIE